MTAFVRIVAAATIAGASLSAAAQAAEPGYENASVALDTRSVDLASDAGRATMTRRIRAAALEVCGDGDVADLAIAARARACQAKAIAAGTKQLDVAVAQARNGNRLASAVPAGSAAN